MSAGGRPLKVLMVTPWASRLGGGVAESVRQLAAGLKRDGQVEIEIATLDDPLLQDDLGTWPTIKLSAHQRLGSRRFGFSPGLLWRVLRSDADVIHVHGVWQFHGFAAWLWSKVRQRPYLVTPHGMLERWIRARSPQLKRLVSAVFHDHFLRDAHAVQLVSAAEDIGGLAPPLCRYVPNFVVETTASPEGKPDWWTSSMEGRTIYLFLGRIHEKKGWRQLCAAWRLCCADPQFRDRSELVFCGWIDDGPDFDATVGSLTRDFGNAVYAGPQFGFDKAASFAAASVFVLPSKSEGLPMGVLESWHAGLPVLMTVACNLDAGFERGAALRVGESPDEIAGGLLAFDALSAEERIGMGKAGKALVADEFSEARVVAAMIALYRDVASEQSQ